MHPLPPYARRIEYLESTGTQWLDTGFAPTATTRVEMTGLFSPERDPAVFTRFGSRYSATQSCFGFNSNASGGALRFDLGTSSTASGAQWQAGADTATRVVIDANTKYAAYVTDTGTLVEHTFTSNMTFVDALPLAVFAFNANPMSSAAWQMRVSSLQIWNNGSPVRSFVPCRILDTGYLWDEVEGRFYGNQGTGDFVLGQDVREGVIPTRMNPFGVGRRIDEIRRVEYLESTGSQYVDTGVVPGNNALDFSLTVVNLVTIGTLGAFGCRADIANGVYVPSNYSAFFCQNSGLEMRADIINSGAARYVALTAGVAYRLDYDCATNTLTKTNLDAGASASFSTSEKAQNDNTFLLFGINTAGTKAAGAQMRIYAATFSVGGVIVRDFVPVAIGSTGYLLDRVSGRLFGNQGTGDFVLGPDIVPVEYVESTGSQYIDTGVLPSQDLTFSCRFMCVNVNTGYGNVFGTRYASGQREYILCAWTHGFAVVGSSCKTPIGIEPGNVYDVSYDGSSTLTVDGTQMTMSTAENFADVGTILAFGIRNGGSPAQLAATRIYGLSLGSVRSFVPVKIGTEGALYDRVTDTVFRSATSTPLVAGPDV